MESDKLSLLKISGIKVYKKQKKALSDDQQRAKGSIMEYKFEQKIDIKYL